MSGADSLKRLSWYVIVLLSQACIYTDWNDQQKDAEKMPTELKFSWNLPVLVEKKKQAILATTNAMSSVIEEDLQQTFPDERIIHAGFTAKTLEQERRRRELNHQHTERAIARKARAVKAWNAIRKAKEKYKPYVRDGTATVPSDIEEVGDSHEPQE